METSPGLFVGMKISPVLQSDLDSPAPGTKHYFDGSMKQEYLSVVEIGTERMIGRFVKDGCSAVSIADVSRNICSILGLIGRGRRVEASELHLYFSAWQ